MMQLVSIRLPVLIVLCVLVASCAPTVSVLRPVPVAQRGALALNTLSVSYDTLLEAQKGFEGELLVAALTHTFEDSFAERGVSGGPVATDVEVEILGYREANAALSIIIGDNAEISGYVRLRQEGSEGLLGEYFVSVVKGDADLLGVATAMLNEEGLSREFVKAFFEALDEPVAP